MENSVSPMFQYLPQVDLTPAQLLQELHEAIEPHEMAFYLKYISRALVTSDEFCGQPAAFRASVMWFLDLIEDFSSRSIECQTPQS